MKTPQKMIRSYYWSCEIDSHRHKEKDTALRCIARTQAVKKPSNKWDIDSLRSVVSSIESGSTFRDLALQYGVTRGRMQQVYEKALRKIAHEKMMADYYAARSSPSPDLH